ncbi:hypothetical protein GEOBRER4_n2647 [Citrifermentans bremense]|uniref:Uncharacterized protein n=1 Tax=Citrifermentans bremense TaxID=60035 RepID=A0A7R7IYR3_9BACT|nr:hypothetical protein GEOBRER4_n2647 [Citrifermentans bremense]
MKVDVIVAGVPATVNDYFSSGAADTAAAPTTVDRRSHWAR